MSGAFDRVSARRLLEKLEHKGIPPALRGVFESWLRDRSAKVVVGGGQSAPMTMRNMVFQGTVWGPTLWNLFFEDSREPVNEAGFEEAVYADDLNAFREFDRAEEDSTIVEDCRKLQGGLHARGHANQEVFDPCKESIHVLGP